MAEVPIYRSQVAAPNIGSLSIAPVQVPDLHSGEGLSQGAQELGQALVRYAAFKKNAEDETRTATAMTGFITGLDQDKTAAAQDPNYETAPAAFRANAEKRKQEALDAARLDPADRAKFDLTLTQHILPALGTVDTAALGKHVDAASAARGQLALQLSSKAAFASSEAEAAAMSKQYYDRLASDQKSGLVAADVAEKARQDFDASVAEQRITRMIREKPLEAVKTLADPNQLTGMDPSRREQFRNAAYAAADELQKYDLVREASGSTPWKASLRLNKALSPQQADDIYNKGILQIGGPQGRVTGKGFMSVFYRIESGGKDVENKDATTSSGRAQGYFQITTDTWREFAARAGVDTSVYKQALGSPYEVQAKVAGIIPMGRWDPITLNALRRAGYTLDLKASLAQNLAANGGGSLLAAGAGGAPNVEGLTRWRSNLAALDNNIALAAAAQVSSLDKAKEYQAKAIETYGPDATPLEIATIITDKTTHDYVMQLFGYMAVPPTGSGVTPGARFQTYTAVQSVVDKQQAEQERIIKELAGLQRAGQGGDDFLEQLKQGHAVWTPEFNTIYQTQKQAAAFGSTEAAGFVSKVDTGIEAQPHTAAAWQMTPAQLDHAIARLDAAAVAAPATHAEIVQLAAYRAVRAEIGDKYKTDTIGLGQRAGLFAAVPLDPQAAPDDPQFLGALAARGIQATRAAGIYGPVLPLRPDDVAGFKDRFANADVEGKLALLDAFHQALGERAYKAALDQVGLDPATATAGRFAADDPGLAKKILIGDSYKKVPGVEKGATAIAAAASETIGGALLYPPGSPALADTLNAAENVYLANRGQDALFKPVDVPAMKAAITEVVGELVTVGGRKVAAPPGISAPRMEELWTNLSDEQLTAARPALPRFTGADPVVDQAGRPVAAEELTAHAVLLQKVPRGSEYYVTDAAGNRYFRQDHSALVLDFKRLDAHAARDAAAAAAADLQAARDKGMGAPAPKGFDQPPAPPALMEAPPIAPPPAAPPAAAPAIGPAPSVQLPPPAPGEPMSAFSAVPRIEP